MQFHGSHILSVEQFGLSDLSLLFQTAAKLEPVEGITEGGRLCVRGPNVMLGYLNADNPGTSAPPDCGRLGPAQLTVASSLRLPPLLSVQVTPTLSPALPSSTSLAASLP